MDGFPRPGIDIWPQLYVLRQGWLFCIYGGETSAANSAWLPHNCGKTISTADAAEMAGQLAIFGGRGEAGESCSCTYLRHLIQIRFVVLD